jgi:UrcA family protein
MLARPLPALAVAALTALAVATAGPALAEDLETTSILVTFGDLDLATSHGMARLDTRLRTAAYKVCDSGLRDVHSLRVDRECRAKALEGARTEVAALLGGRSGRTQVAMRR